MRLSFCSLVVLLTLFAVAYKTRPRQLNDPPAFSVANLHTEAAYRDGLYLGRLQRKQALRPHPATGRWSRQADRQLFQQGYALGYNGEQE